MRVHLAKPSLWLFVSSIVLAYIIYERVQPHYTLERRPISEIRQDSLGKPYFSSDDQNISLSNAVSLQDSYFTLSRLAALNQGKGSLPPVSSQIVYEWTNPSIEPEPEPVKANPGKPDRKAAAKHGAKLQKQYYELKLKKHYGLYSLYPALVAIVFCWLTREPLFSLFVASVSGAIMLGSFDYLEKVLLPALMSKNAALILVLYLWLLGGLLGIWARTGAGRAFAQWVTQRFVRGPNSARLVAWILGILFFQGGTVSTVLVGTTVKPVADQQKISHEELSYIVDSTASPIACLIAFNAWPAYIQAFLYLPGVAFLASESERIAFFFRSLPLSFYALFAILGTFLFCFDKLPLIGEAMRRARKRARTQGELDRPEARPLHSTALASETEEKKIADYKATHWEFVLPLGLLLAIAVISFIVSGSPQVHLAFAAALLWSASSALLRGLKLSQVISAFGEGCKSVLMGALILLFALVIGQVTTQTGGGLYLVELLGTSIAYWLLPLVLLALTVLIAFSTGTSWGTYALVYPLAMPLAWAVAQGSNLSQPELFLSLCFAVVLNGSVIGDQSSPISDTTILSSMCTGCDLMDHVKTQIVPVAWATGLAALAWTLVALAC